MRASGSLPPRNKLQQVLRPLGYVKLGLVPRAPLSVISLDFVTQENTRSLKKSPCVNINLNFSLSLFSKQRYLASEVVM